jgi:hypothetical protein
VTVDLDRGTMYSTPMRDRNRDFIVLPDGTFLMGPARFNAACGHMGMWPHPMPSCVGDEVYVRDALGLCRVDLHDASIAWRCPIPWPHTIWNDRSDGLIAAGGGIVAMLERGSLCIADAATGGLRAAIRTAGRHIACDGSRVYVADLTEVRAYSTHQVDPARPDPTDAGDPACYLARCRAALLAGDFDGALPAIRGIGVAAGLRKETLDEAAELLSQLARSPNAKCLMASLFLAAASHAGTGPGQETFRRVLFEAAVPLGEEAPPVAVQSNLVAFGAGHEIKVFDVLQQEVIFARSLVPGATSPSLAYETHPLGIFGNTVYAYVRHFTDPDRLDPGGKVGAVGCGGGGDPGSTKLWLSVSGKRRSNQLRI